MAVWAREEEKASKDRQMKREAEEAAKVEADPEMSIASLIHFKVALIGLTKGSPMRRRLRRQGSLKIIPERERDREHGVVDIMPFGANAG